MKVFKNKVTKIDAKTWMSFLKSQQPPPDCYQPLCLAELFVTLNGKMRVQAVRKESAALADHEVAGMLQTL